MKGGKHIAILIFFLIFVNVHTINASNVSCGNTILEDTVLDSDLNCQDTLFSTALNIGANDITLDCNSHIIVGTGPSPSVFANGILAKNKANIIIKNCNIQNSGSGIRLEATNNSILINNTAINNNIGFHLKSASYNLFSFNKAINNNAGSSLNLFSSYNTFTHNIAENNSNSGFDLSSNSSFNNFIENIAAGNNDGFLVVYSPSQFLLNNIASNNVDRGLLFLRSPFSNITSNLAVGNRIGFDFQLPSNDNSITGNKAINNTDFGFHLLGASNNLLSLNFAKQNQIGFEISSSDDNMISNNIIESNSLRGLDFTGTSSRNEISSNTVTANSIGIASTSQISHAPNLIYNNFFNNTVNAVDIEYINFWNTTKQPGRNIIDGQYIGGNFWSDYTGEDLDGDGIGDTLLPYNSRLPSGHNRIQYGGDFLPLVFLPLDTDGDGINDIQDSCISTPGKIEYHGCPVGDDNLVEFNIKDRANASCQDSKKCRVPAEGAIIKVFDRNNAEFQARFSSHPKKTEFPNIFESNIAIVGSCITKEDGRCIAGEERIGEYLVVIKVINPFTEENIYIGKSKDFRDFKDTDGDGVKDLAFLQFRINMHT